MFRRILREPLVHYRFARGEEVVSATGQRVKLGRPLDFLVVADHVAGVPFCRRGGVITERALVDSSVNRPRSRPAARSWSEPV
jgi:hypothetical protein